MNDLGLNEKSLNSPLMKQDANQWTYPSGWRLDFFVHRDVTAYELPD